MSFCREEFAAHGGHGGHSHDHGHGHDGHGHGGHGHDGHDHSDDLEPAVQFSLYQHIRFDDIITLNEARTDMGKAVVKKTWDERLEPQPELVSDADDQMIMNIPFTGQVKLHCILLRSSLSLCAPRTLRVFVNRDDVDFDNAEDLKPTQEFELSRTSEVQMIPVRRALFGKVQRLTLFFVDNFCADTTGITTAARLVDTMNGASFNPDQPSRLTYLGFRGEWMQLGRAPSQILYEAAPNPNDHAVKGVNVNLVGNGIQQ